MQWSWNWISMSEVKVKTTSSKMFFILMSLIVTGPFKIVANNTNKNYFDCLKKYKFWNRRPENDHCSHLRCICDNHWNLWTCKLTLFSYDMMSRISIIVCFFLHSCLQSRGNLKLLICTEITHNPICRYKFKVYFHMYENNITTDNFLSQVIFPLLDRNA